LYPIQELCPQRHWPGRASGPAFLLLSLCLGGCSINPEVDTSGLTQTGERRQLEVPFFPQEQYQCGPAALATVLVASGVETSPDILTPQIYLPERQGSLQPELLAASRRAGRIPYVIENDLDPIFAQLESGRPVLLLQNLRTQRFPVWHYAVLTGYEPASETVFLNTGTRQNEAMSIRKFARLWDWAGNWAMIVLKPGEIPPLADPENYFTAVANFETIAGLTPAEAAWRSAIEQWPDNPQPYLALGNQAYARGDLAHAAGLYHQGLSADAQSPGLANNLASVLGELGCPRKGESILQPVAANLASDSAWRDIIAATLAELAGGTEAPDANCELI
jgi:tetratricopeptide (TPR) repeat protein